MATIIRKAVPADAKAIADIFNGFVTRHDFGVKPSWTAENTASRVASEGHTVLVMEVDGKIQAFFALAITDGVARVDATAWTVALETWRPDPQFTFGDWMAGHQAELGAAYIEAVWHKDNPFGGLILRAAAANLLRPTGDFIGKATEVTQEGDFIRMIATLDSFGKWFKQRKAADWTRLYKS